MTTSPPFFDRILRHFETNRTYQFWGLQIIGWGGLCVVTFLSLTVWYGTPNWRHVSHTLIQAILGMVLTLPLRAVYRKYWHRRLLHRLIIILISVTLVSVIWTALRMQTFLWLGEEYDIWKDFGGWYFGSFMVFLCWAVLYYSAKLYQALQDVQLKRLSAEAGAREAEIKMLRYQLNPHFLFNTLNSISALVKTKRTDQARAMITQLSDFLRFSLDNDANQLVTVSDEVKNLLIYLDIEKVRYGERLNMQLEIDDRARSVLVPSLILQPLLENALKYAVAGRISGGTIRVKGVVSGGSLHLTVEDSGPGMSPELYENGSVGAFDQGVGLKNVRDRLHSEFGDSAILFCNRSDLGGHAAHIIVPMHEDRLSVVDLAS